MRHLILCSAAVAAALSGPAWAGDKVLTAPLPAWVTPAPPIVAATVPRTGNLMPRFDEQFRVEGDTVTAYFDSVKVVSSAEALTQLGTFAMNWQPDQGDLTFHRIEILRGDQTIDALKDGAGITVLRREAGLERLVVDGQLTAVKHIEGLRTGDLVRVALSISVRDSTLAGNVQNGGLLLPAPVRLGFGRARVIWPTDRAIAWKILTPGVSATPRRLDARWTELVVPLPTVKLPEMPKNVPGRFQPMPLLLFSSFADWGAVAKVMAPLYKVEGAIAPGSDLAAKVDAIAARSDDPLRRTADALRLVQDEVRYQLVALGTGNYVPQTPAETWAKRYGDCKAKTLLLLAILDRLGIAAEPVLANGRNGDAVAQMLPAPMAFDHVFVRATIKGEDYWLDGTMLGSRFADIRNVPRYGRVLPLFAANAGLVELPRRANARPDLDIDLAYDMTAGPHLPAPFHLTLRYAGPYAATNKIEDGSDFDQKLTEFAEKAAKSWANTSTIGKPSSRFDPEAAVWTVAIDGVAYPDWEYREGRYGLAVEPSLQITYDAPRDRASWRAIPALIEQPWTAHGRFSIDLPNDDAIAVTGDREAALAIPAVDWRRTVSVTGNHVVEEIMSRESGAEIPADRVSATSAAIAEVIGKTTHIALAPTYPQRWDDLARMRAKPALAKVRAIFDQRIAERPDDATRLADRAWLGERLLDWAKAEADYGKAIALDGSAARYLARARFRAGRGDHPGALQDAQAAYDLESGNAEARYQLALELAQAGKVDEGLEILPTDPDIMTEDGLATFLQRLNVLELGGRHDDALSLLDGALERRGSSAELRNARCWYLGLRNSALDTALADCNRAIELSSNPAVYLDSRALVHFQAGRLEAARTDYAAALAASPEQASALFMNGVVLTRLGDKAKGAADQRAARAVRPDIEQFYRRFGIGP
ncbi:MAG TPA: DUF3857 domain-containing protein [Novosphingobium sp.]